MRRVAILSAALAATVLAGCATSSLTPTVEPASRSSATIFKVWSITA